MTQNYNIVDSWCGWARRAYIKFSQAYAMTTYMIMDETTKPTYEPSDELKLLRLVVGSSCDLGGSCGQVYIWKIKFPLNSTRMNEFRNKRIKKKTKVRDRILRDKGALNYIIFS